MKRDRPSGGERRRCRRIRAPERSHAGDPQRRGKMHHAAVIGHTHFRMFQQIDEFIHRSFPGCVPASFRRQTVQDLRCDPPLAFRADGDHDAPFFLHPSASQFPEGFRRPALGRAVCRAARNRQNPGIPAEGLQFFRTALLLNVFPENGHFSIPLFRAERFGHRKIFCRLMGFVQHAVATFRKRPASGEQKRTEAGLCAEQTGNARPLEIERIAERVVEQHSDSGLKALDGPIVLHVKTKKGKGYKPAEDDPTLYHGVGKFDPVVGIQPSAAPTKKTYTQLFSDWICDTAERDKTLYAITPAMREGSGLVEFEKRFPERYRDVAIAEQHAVTFAAGLACAGIHPVVAIYSTFAQRAYDQIVHDVAIQDLPVLFAIDRAGLVGADGRTHHGLFDIAFLRSLPNMTVITPSDENEMRLLLNTAWTLQTPVAVRYPRGTGPGVEVTADTETVEIGKSKTVRTTSAPKGKRVAILAFGSMVWRLTEVAEVLDATLVDMRFVKPLDEEAVLKAAAEHDLLVTAEEGIKAGGAGSAVLEFLSEAGQTTRTHIFGIPDVFIDHGDTEVLMTRSGLDPAHVRAKIEAALS